MDITERLPAGDQAVLLGNREREGVFHSGERLQKKMDDPPEETRGETAVASRLIDGNDAAHLQRLAAGGVTVRGRRENFILRLHHLQAALVKIHLHLAVESQILAGLDQTLEIGGVEPFAVQPVGSLANLRLKNFPFFPAQAQHPGPHHRGNHRSRLSRAHLSRTAQHRAVFISEGNGVQQVLGGGNALVVQNAGPFLPYAFDELDRGGQCDHRVQYSMRIKEAKPARKVFRLPAYKSERYFLC